MVDIEKYKEMGFNREQLDEIRLGIVEKVDVSIYADPKFNWKQMNQIRRGLKKGIDVSIYADTKYNNSQMFQIRLGLQEGIDVSIYADPKFGCGQMEEIRWGLENGVDISFYADPKFNRNQMETIRWGLEKGVDVSVYADHKFSEEQMERIRRALEKGYSVSKILDKNLSYEEAAVILEKENPSIKQFLKNFNIVNDDKKAIFYKAVRKLNNTTFCSNYNENFIYEIGKVASEPNVDRDVNETCAKGIHVSSLAWAKDFAIGWNNTAFIEVEVDIDNIVLPIDTDGKIRVSHAKVLREVF